MHRVSMESRCRNEMLDRRIMPQIRVMPSIDLRGSSLILQITGQVMYPREEMDYQLEAYLLTDQMGIRRHMLDMVRPTMQARWWQVTILPWVRRLEIRDYHRVQLMQLEHSLITNTAWCTDKQYSTSNTYKRSTNSHLMVETVEVGHMAEVRQFTNQSTLNCLQVQPHPSIVVSSIRWANSQTLTWMRAVKGIEDLSSLFQMKHTQAEMILLPVS